MSLQLGSGRHSTVAAPGAQPPNTLSSLFRPATTPSPFHVAQGTSRSTTPSAAPVAHYLACPKP